MTQDDRPWTPTQLRWLLLWQHDAIRTASRQAELELDMLIDPHPSWVELLYRFLNICLLRAEDGLTRIPRERVIRGVVRMTIPRHDQFTGIDLRAVRDWRQRREAILASLRPLAPSGAREAYAYVKAYDTVAQSAQRFCPEKLL